MAAAETGVSFYHALNITQKAKDKNLPVFTMKFRKFLSQELS